MKVVVSSFHSCSAYALQSASIVFDALVSFDSHIDTQLLGYRKDVVNAIGNNLPLFYTASRSSTHAIFARMFNDFISTNALLIPKVALETDLATFEERLVKRMTQAIDAESERLSALINAQNKLQVHTLTIKKIYGLDVVASSPKDPVSVVNQILEGS
jgi:hypothetical protein